MESFSYGMINWLMELVDFGEHGWMRLGWAANIKSSCTTETPAIHTSLAFTHE